MRSSTVAWIVIVLVVLGGAWYAWSHMSPHPTTTPSDQTQTVQNSSGNEYQPGNLLLGTDASGNLGTYLIGSNGMTLYTYAKDTDHASNCSGQCATNWPPYLIASKDVLANVQAGIPGAVDSITRTDGSMQVVYNGHPLYFYLQDKKSGDTTGQNVGGVWFVVKP